MDNIAQTKWVVTSVDSGKEIFAGWIREADGESYLNFQVLKSPISIGRLVSQSRTCRTYNSRLLS